MRGEERRQEGRGEDRIRQDKTGKNKDKTGQGRTGQDMARLG